MTAIAKINKGYLLPEIFTQSNFQMITDYVISMVQNTNPKYVLALLHMNHYYEMKLVTSVVDNHHYLEITFPLFIKALNRGNVVLYQIIQSPCT